MISKEKFLDAVEMFGIGTVQEVRALVSVSDPDGAYTHFEDEEMLEHAECLAFLYFEE